MAAARKTQARTDGRTSRGTFRKGVSGNPSGTSKAHHRPDGELDVLAQRVDGWMSQQTGFGTALHDKRIGHRFVTDCVTYRDAMEMWRGDDLAARAIEQVPGECFRRGYEIKIADEASFPDLKEKLEKMLETLRVDQHIEQAYRYERAYGGGALLLGINDGQTMDQEVDLDRVTSLDYVTPLEPIELYPLEYYTDPREPKFNKPKIWQLSTLTRAPSTGGDNDRILPPTTRIHESRLVIFEGTRVSEFQGSGANTAGSAWGDSSLTRFFTVLRDFNIAWQSAGIIVVDFSQGVFTMQNLAQLMAANKQSQIIDRLRLIEMARSTARAVVIDANETFTRQSTSLSGLPDLLDRLSKRLAAAIDMPLTLLMGVATTGGTEGEADVRFFYDRVAVIQARKIKPVLLKIIQILMRVIGKVEPDKWGLRFHPLWQPTDKERVDARNIQAQMDNIYVSMGALTPEEVRQSRFGGEYSFETQLIEEPAAPTAGAGPQLDPAALEAMGRDPETGAALPAAGASPGLTHLPGAAAPAAPGAPGDQPGAPPMVEAAKVALNGAQVTSLLEIVRSAVAGEIPREGAIQVIAAAYPTITPQQALQMLGSPSFEPKVEPAPAAPAFGKPPAPAADKPAAEEPKPPTVEPKTDQLRDAIRARRARIDAVEAAVISLIDILEAA